MNLYVGSSDAVLLGLNPLIWQVFIVSIINSREI
jgi:hypothetical protein